MNTMKWLIKREFWEHKGGFLWTPLTIGAIVLLLVAMVLFSGKTSGHSHTSHSSFAWAFGSGAQVRTEASSTESTVPKPPGAAQSDDVESSTSRAETIENIAKESGTLTALPILLAAYFVSLFYLVGTLYEERKNRSVLLWKSLPVTDTATVLSKVAMALIIAPALAYVIAAIFGFLILTLCALAQVFAGQLNLSLLFGRADAVQVPFLLLGSIPVYALWALPTAGALLVVSAWARTNPLLWVISVPLGVGAGLSWLNYSFGFTENMDWYWRDIVGRGLLSNAPFSWLALKPPGHPVVGNIAGSAEMTFLFTSSWQLLTTANLWIGAAAGVAMIYAAIRIRRWKDEG